MQKEIRLRGGAMRLVTLTVLTIFIFVSSPFGQTQRAPFREQVNLDFGTYRGQAELQVETPTLIRGKTFTCRVTFNNSREGRYFYNPFFNNWIDLPAQLAVFDRNREYIGNLFWQADLKMARGPEDWVYVGKGFVGTSFKMIAGHVPGTRYEKSKELLPKGSYYLQMIYYGVFLHPRHELDSKQERDKWDELDNKEMFRSNLVKVELTDE